MCVGVVFLCIIVWLGFDFRLVFKVRRGDGIGGFLVCRVVGYFGGER